MNLIDLKNILQENIKDLKVIKFNSSRFDSIRVDLESYGYSDIKEAAWNILNDFPEHRCKECGNDTDFKSYQSGYKEFCNVTCANRFKGKQPEIREKISASVSDFHSKQDDSYWDKRTAALRKTIREASEQVKQEKRRSKSETTKAVHENRTEDERKEHNNKISVAVKNSEKAKKQRIKRAKLGAKALNDYRKTLKSEELKEFNKRFGSKDVIGDDRDRFKEYYKLVWFFTRQNLHLVENIEKRSIDYHLDHKYSIKQGFLDNMPPEIIGSNINLEILPAKLNASKGSSCSVTKEFLLNSFDNLKIGDF